MRVHLGSDHAGFELKAHLTTWLHDERYEVVDHGPVDYDRVDDYPPFVLRAAAAAVNDPGSLAVVIGGSGNGEAMAANKVPGVRAALAWNDDTAELAREHNDANVVSIGARMHTVDEATSLVERFLTTPFSGDPRHQRRIDMIAGYETSHDLPELPEPPTGP
jgi:ribose 5-phosphate isomerase B